MPPPITPPREERKAPPQTGDSGGGAKLQGGGCEKVGNKHEVGDETEAVSSPLTVVDVGIVETSVNEVDISQSRRFSTPEEGTEAQSCSESDTSSLSSTEYNIVISKANGQDDDVKRECSAQGVEKETDNEQKEASVSDRGARLLSDENGAELPRCISMADVVYEQLNVHTTQELRKTYDALKEDDVTKEPAYESEIEALQQGMELAIRRILAYKGKADSLEMNLARERRKGESMFTEVMMLRNELEHVSSLARESTFQRQQRHGLGEDYRGHASTKQNEEKISIELKKKLHEANVANEKLRASERILRKDNERLIREKMQMERELSVERERLRIDRQSRQSSEKLRKKQRALECQLRDLASRNLERTQADRKNRDAEMWQKLAINENRKHRKPRPPEQQSLKTPPIKDAPSIKMAGH